MTLPVQHADILAAVPRVRAVLPPTPLYLWPGLSKLLGCEFYAKHENYQPVGAFKVRGGVNLLASLTADQRRNGLLGCSTGNHGQSLAFACQRAGVPCTIVVPAVNNPDKIKAMRLRGAEVIEYGQDFDEAREYLERELVPRGGRYIHSANEPLLIAGVGTMGEEIFAELPDPDVIVVPIGLGSGICGNAIVAKTRRPATRVIGVQAEGAAAVARAWQTGQLEAGQRAHTWAEGMATRVPAEMTLEIMRALVDDVILVSDNQLLEAAWWLLEHTHNLVEGAGAAALAAVAARRADFAGQRVVGIISGGNLDIQQLPAILRAGGILP